MKDRYVEKAYEKISESSKYFLILQVHYVAKDDRPLDILNILLNI